MCAISRKLGVIFDSRYVYIALIWRIDALLQVLGCLRAGCFLPHADGDFGSGESQKAALDQKGTV